MAVTDGRLFFHNFRKVDGTPYSGVRVFHYEPGGGTVDKNIYANAALSTPEAQPYVGSTNGWVKFYGDGPYRMIIRSSVADGDVLLDDLDPISLNEKAATLRPENQAASYPAATAANRGQIAAKTSSGNITEIGINKDGSGFVAIQLQSDPLTTTVSWAKGADIASAATLTLGSDGNFWDVTGTVPTTAFSAKPAGTWIRLRIISAGWVLTHNATSMRLRNGRNYSSSAGDVLDFISLGSGNWQEATSRQNVVGSVMPFENCFLVATVAANVLTVALKTEANADPTTADPCRIGFLDSPITTGGYSTVEVTAALSMVASAGSTFGFTANQASRLYVGALKNGTSAELFLYHPLIGTNAKRINEALLYTTVSEGGAGGADSAQTLYSTTARATVPVRLLGYLDITTGGTPGNWTANPSAIRLLGPGVPRTNDVIQSVRVTESDLVNSAALIPVDDSIPQSGEGVELTNLAVTIAPSNLVNLLSIEVLLQGSHNTATTQIVAALFQDATASALQTSVTTSPNGANQHVPVVIAHRMIAGTVASTTFKVRVGTTAGQMNFNGIAGTRQFGGTLTSHHIVTEICL